MIPRIGYVEFTETQSQSTTYSDLANVLVDGNFMYIIFHYGGTGGPSYLIRYDMSNDTYESLYLGTGFTAGAPLVKYDDNHLVTAIFTSDFVHIRFIVIDINAFNIAATFSITHNQYVGDFAQSKDLFKRKDGGLTYIFYAKNSQNYSARNAYVINLSVEDIANGLVSKENEFYLGTVGRFIQTSNGLYLYHPNQDNALVNKDNFRFLLWSDDDTFQTWYYYDGSQAPVPFTPVSADLSKVNSYINVMYIPKIHNPFINNEYYITGYDVNKYAAFEIDDTSFQPINHRVTPYDGVLYFYGDSINLLLWKTDESIYIYKITDSSINQLADALIYYKFAVFPYVFNNKFYVFAVHDNGSYVVGGVSIYNLEDIGYVPESTKKMYPFWLRGGE